MRDDVDLAPGDAPPNQEVSHLLAWNNNDPRPPALCESYRAAEPKGGAFEDREVNTVRPFEVEGVPLVNDICACQRRKVQWSKDGCASLPPSGSQQLKFDSLEPARDFEYLPVRGRSLIQRSWG